ncbi:MAG TPA: hypothetical protein VF792_03580 [Ktedonobacterales bacterium]
MTSIIRYTGEFLKHLVGVALLCWRRMLRAAMISFGIGVVLAMLIAVISTGQAFPGVLSVVVALIFGAALAYGVALTIFLDEFLMGAVDLIKMLEGDVMAVAHITAEVGEREAGDVAHGLRRLFGIVGAASHKGPLAPTRPTFPASPARRAKTALEVAAGAAAVAGAAGLAGRFGEDHPVRPVGAPQVAQPVRADHLPRIGWTLEHEAIRPPQPSVPSQPPVAEAAVGVASAAALAAAAGEVIHHVNAPTLPETPAEYTPSEPLEPTEPAEDERLAEPAALAWPEDELPTEHAEPPAPIYEQPTLDMPPHLDDQPTLEMPPIEDQPTMEMPPVEDHPHVAPFIAPAAALPAMGVASAPVDIAMLARAANTNPLSPEMLQRAANTNPLPAVARPPAPDTHPLAPEALLIPAPTTTPLAPEALAAAPTTTPLPPEMLAKAPSTTPLFPEFQSNTLETPLIAPSIVAAAPVYEPTEEPTPVAMPAPAPKAPRQALPVIDPLLGVRSRSTTPLTPEEMESIAPQPVAPELPAAQDEPPAPRMTIFSEPPLAAEANEPVADEPVTNEPVANEPVANEAYEDPMPEPPVRSRFSRITQPVEGLASHFDSFSLNHGAAPSQRVNTHEGGGLWERLSHALTERVGAPSSPFSTASSNYLDPERSADDTEAGAREESPQA